ncbi:hypothetical protein LCGC14_1584500, partial [marine sediment metagenome]
KSRVEQLVKETGKDIKEFEGETLKSLNKFRSLLPKTPTDDVSGQIILTGDTDKDRPKGMPKKPDVIERDIVLSGSTYKIRNLFGNCFVTVNSDDNGNPFEVFVNVGKAGSDIQADAEAIGRLISLILRLSGDVPQSDRLQEIFGQLRGIGSGRSFGYGEDRVCSIPDAIAKVLERHIGKIESNPKDFFTVSCKICGASLPDEKCPTCPNCGWNRCSGT